MLVMVVMFQWPCVLKRQVLEVWLQLGTRPWLQQYLRHANGVSGGMTAELGVVARVVGFLSNTASLAVILWKRYWSARLIKNLSWEMVWSILVSLHQLRSSLLNRLVNLKFWVAVWTSV